MKKWLVISLVVVIGMLGMVAYAGAGEDYWWEKAYGDLPPEYQEGLKQVTIEVFAKLFPEVDLSRMSASEFKEFVKVLPPEVFEKLEEELNALAAALELLPFPEGVPLPEPAVELWELPGYIALYGTIPSFETQHEKREWFNTLHRLMILTRPHLEERWQRGPEYRDRVIVGFSVYAGGVLGVTINKYADIDLNATIRGIYAVIAEKAERIGIEYPPVLFRFGALLGPVIERSLHVPIAVDPKWEIICPWEQWYRPIPGGVQKQAQGLHWVETSTIGFPARHRLWWWIEALVITGHLGPERTPVNLQIWQPRIVAARPHYKAGRVVAVARMGGYADAAKVCFEDIRPPRIHTGGGRLDPVVHWRDPSVGENVTMSGQASAVLRHGVVVAVGQPVGSPTFGTLRKQVLVDFGGPLIDGDSGAPIFRRDPVTGKVTIFGIYLGDGWCVKRGRWLGLISLVSGILTELDVRPLAQ